MTVSSGPAIRLLRMEALGEFSWRWPTGVERFDRGWTAEATIDGLAVRIRHGVGRRTVYGRSRIHSVTWVEGQPMVEGVEADDFPESQALLSLIKVGRRHVRRGDSLPAGYAMFQVVLMSEAVVGAHSPRSQVVKLRIDDIDGWTRHALLRAYASGRIPEPLRGFRSLPPIGDAGPAPIGDGPGSSLNERASVTQALLAFGSEELPTSESPASDFTPNAAANQFLLDSPFAFLVGVIFDQGIMAERAWEAPFYLRERLGHLDPIRLQSSLDRVREEVQRFPKLHRYVEKVPRWVVAAARLVVARYHGDAAMIWSDQPTAAELQRRFDEFAGIGQKKAAMAVEILVRDFRVPITDIQGGDIAYDIHIRRVFLRTRLADRDEREHMIEVARQLNPAHPGALDLPAWRIGRRWCHAGLPECALCPLTTVCPKDIERAARVTSA